MSQWKARLKAGAKKRVKFYGKFLLIWLALQLIPFECIVSDPSIGKEALRAWTPPADSLPLVYSNKYNIDFWGLEKLHPFDSKKYLHVVENLHEKFGWKTSQYITPGLPSWDLLSVAVSNELFRNLQNPWKLARYTELAPLAFMPRGLIHTKVVNPMRRSALGSVLAAKTALARGWAINLSGGFHHAHALEGGGFCLLPDISLVIKWLRDEEHLIQRAMIIDLDAHQGNGHERDFMKDPSVYIFDMYNKEIYPHDEFAKKAIALKIELAEGTENEEYLGKLKDGLARALTEFHPDLIVYNAGTDILIGDPLGLMLITPKGVITRDEMVFRAAREKKIPIVMLLSGGYQKSNAAVIAHSVENLWTLFH